MYFFCVTFNDSAEIRQDGLTKRQAVIRYNKWVRELSVQSVKRVEWGLL